MARICRTGRSNSSAGILRRRATSGLARLPDQITTPSSCMHWNSKLDLSPDATRADAMKAMDGHILAPPCSRRCSIGKLIDNAVPVCDRCQRKGPAVVLALLGYSN